MSPSGLWHTWSKIQMCWMSLKCWHCKARPSLGKLVHAACSGFAAGATSDPGQSGDFQKRVGKAGAQIH